MAHDIEVVPDFKKGDRVQHTGSGWLATVAEDPIDPAWIRVIWEVRSSPEPETYRSTAFRVAPWHGVGYGPVDEATLQADLKKVADAVPFMFKAGDRVKLKYNRSCGTIEKDQVSEHDANIIVRWDKDGKAAWEHIRDLHTLHAPRDTDPANPNQEAIDAIEVQRTKLKKEVEDLQSRLSVLTQAKRLLERG